MIHLMFTLLLLAALALVGYCLVLHNERQPQMSLMVSGIKIYNDHSVTKTLTKNMMRTMQKPMILESQCGGSSFNRISRRSGNSTSSTESSAPMVVGEPSTSSVHLKRNFKDWRRESLNPTSSVMCRRDPKTYSNSDIYAMQLKAVLQ